MSSSEGRKGAGNYTEGLEADFVHAGFAVMKRGTDGLFYRTGAINGVSQGEAERTARHFNKIHRSKDYTVVNARGYIYPPEEFVERGWF